MKDFITMDYIGSLVGVVFVVTLLTQFTKELVDKYIKDIPTKYVTFIYALITMIIFQVCTGTFAWNKFYLTLINSIIATMTAQGGYQWVFEPIEQKNIAETLFNAAISTQKDNSENKEINSQDKTQ